MSSETLMPLRPSRKSEISSTVGGLGVYLRQAREFCRLSQSDVALQLRLSPHVIDAIENDDYHKLPGQIFVRGYLRAYARLVNLPEEEIIQAFNHLAIAQQELPPLAPTYTATSPVYDDTSTPSAKVKSKGGISRWLVSLTVLLFTLMLVLWWLMENPSFNLMESIRSLRAFLATL